MATASDHQTLNYAFFAGQSSTAQFSFYLVVWLTVYLTTLSVAQIT
jgi:hypothetical protein